MVPEDTFAYDSFDHLAGSQFAKMALNFGFEDAKKDELYETPTAPIGSDVWHHPLNEWLGNRYHSNCQEILKKNYSVLSMHRWHLIPQKLFLAGGGMSPVNTFRDHEHPFWYISLLYRKERIASEEVWAAVGEFIKHMEAAPDDIRPLRVFLRPCPVGNDPTLTHLSVLDYRKSKISKQALQQKWLEFGAYESQLPSPAGENWWFLNKQRYRPPKNRNWPNFLPDKSRLKPAKS